MRVARIPRLFLAAWFLRQFFAWCFCHMAVHAESNSYQDGQITSKRGLLDQARARASYTPPFGGRSRSIPQGMILDVQLLVKSLFCPIKRSPNGFFFILRPLSPETGYHCFWGGVKSLCSEGFERGSGALRLSGRPVPLVIGRPGIGPLTWVLVVEHFST